MANTPTGSELDAMAELVKQMWERYIRPRVMDELMKHSLEGYKASVVSNNGDGTLTVVRPFDTQTMTLRCPPALANWAEEGDQVLVVSLGDASNSFILCKTDMEGFGSSSTGERIKNLDFSHLLSNYFTVKTEHDVLEMYTVSRDEHGRIEQIEDSEGFETGVDWPAYEPLPAQDVGYDNTDSGASSTNVQDALDELFEGGGGGGPALSDDDPVMDGATPSPGVSVKASRADHKHQTDSSRASAADLTSHVQNTSNPHGVTKAQVGLENVANERQYSAQNPPPTPSAGDVGAIPSTEKGSARGVATLDSNGKVPAGELDLSGKQDEITASGILKGDGQGGVSAAVAGTDYQAPLTAGTDYATPTQLADKANQAQLAYVETGTTASRAYSVGEYFCWNGLLYRVTSAISSGGTITPGTNCEQATVGNELITSHYVELGHSTNTGSWQAVNLSRAISKFKFVYIAATYVSGSTKIDRVCLVVPAAYFKTKTASSNYIGGYAVINANNDTLSWGCYYNSDSRASFYTSRADTQIYLYGCG